MQRMEQKANNKQRAHVKYYMHQNNWNEIGACPFCSECGTELYDEDQKYCHECGARLSGKVELAKINMYVE